tara:strand:+ start:535 stop:3621 length:3087 start_codon:yes stop_codon:yes gene_type:complete
MKKFILNSILLLFLFNSYSQQKNNDGKFWTGNLEYKFVPSIAEQLKDGSFIPAVKNPEVKEIYDKRLKSNKVILGKGLPNGMDPLVSNNKQAYLTKQTREPSLVFETLTDQTNGCPSDPTGAIGVDYYLAAWNPAFRIYDRSGNPVIPAASLSNLLGSNFGDPIAFYDAEADRYVITAMAQGLLQLAISQTGDPVSDGWHTFSIQTPGTSGLPDYPKYSIWSDGYYVSVNANANDFYVLERDKIINGDQSASIQGSTVPGMATGNFASPFFFSVSDDNLPNDGDATMVYFQDDAWFGVNQDHLKLWTVDIDWNNSNNSTVSNPTEINVTPFTSVFDGGSFQNLTLPNGYDIDAVQGAIMNLAQYREFPNYNSAIFNFVVNTTGINSNELAGVRWYELRQDSQGEAWSVFQEGTYTAPDGRHAFMASMIMDYQGNIGMGYSSMSSSDRISSNYTGRYANDPAGQMTVEEQRIANSISNPSNCGGRYADYSHISVDPTNDKTFWFNTEYFAPNMRDVVGVFQIASNFANDVGVVSIDSPIDGSLSSSENITVSVFNYGEDPVSNFDISFQVDSQTVVTETYTGSLASNETGEFTFSITADLSSTGSVYEICAYTSLSADEDSSNDNFCGQVQSLSLNDLGVSNIISPVSASILSSTEQVIIEITNYGGADQSDFDVSYELNGVTVTETVSGPISANSTLEYIFNQTIDLSFSGDYEITSSTLLENDSDNSNNSFTVSVSVNCPEEYSLPIIWKDDFECYDPYSISDIGDWLIYDYDEGTTWGANAVDFDNEGYVGSGIIFNYPLSGTTDEVWSSYQGDQGLYFFASGSGGTTFPNDDWMISPEFNVDGVSSPILSFWAKSLTDQYGLDRFQIGIGSTTNPSDFTIISGGGAYEEAPTEWTQYEYDLSEYIGQTIRVGIHCVNNDSFVLQMDEFKVEGTLGIDDSFIYDSEFKIISQENNQFNISLATTYSENISFSVYTISGQTLVFNNISKETDKYIYDLDMSYAASGVYLVKMGNSKVGYKFGRIIVK